MNSVENMILEKLRKETRIYKNNIFLLIAELNNTIVFRLLVKEFGDSYLLKNFGGNVNGLDLYGRAPIHYLTNSISLIEILTKEYKADVNIKNSEGSTVAFGAAESGKLKVLQYLSKDKHCNLQIKNNKGQSILRRVVDFHQPTLGKNLFTIITFLVDQNLDPYEKDFYNKSAYDIAKENKSSDILKLFKKH